FIMGMDAAVTEQSHHVKCAVVVIHMVHCTEQDLIVEEIAVFDGFVDACQTLIDDAAGTDIEVADFRVAHLAFRETYIKTACRQFIMRVFLKEAVEIRLVGSLDRIPFHFIPVGEAVKDDQSNWSGHCLAPSTSAMKDSDSRDAPPTSAPSICSCDMYSSTFAGFTEPPYWMRMASAVSSSYRVASVARTCPHISFASALVADLPVPIAQIGSYAMTDAFTWSEDRSASALVTWSLTRDSALPPSRSSSVSPQQMIGTSPFACRACAFLLTVSSVSAKCSRRSEWPTMTYFTPRSSSIAGDTSPLNAPLSSKWLFSAPMPSSEPSAFATSEGRWMNGAQMALSTSSFFGRAPSASMNASPSETVLFIFQLPAINGVLIYILLVSFGFTCYYLSSMTVSPGSSLPSRYSSEAPPPVEMWEKSSA